MKILRDNYVIIPLQNELCSTQAPRKFDEFSGYLKKKKALIPKNKLRTTLIIRMELFFLFWNYSCWMCILQLNWEKGVSFWSKLEYWALPFFLRNEWFVALSFFYCVTDKNEFISQIHWIYKAGQDGYSRKQSNGYPENCEKWMQIK